MNTEKENEGTSSANEKVSATFLVRVPQRIKTRATGDGGNMAVGSSAKNNYKNPPFFIVISIVMVIICFVIVVLVFVLNFPGQIKSIVGKVYVVSSLNEKTDINASEF